MPLEKRLGGRSASLGGEAGTPWGSSGGRDQFQLSEQELADLRKLQQLHVSQARLLADGNVGFKSWGGEKELSGEPSRRKGLPPRAPPNAMSGPKQRELNTLPSMVDRINDSSKAFVDPKDAQNLLPSALLDSSSLDLASYLEAFDPHRQGDHLGLPTGGIGETAPFDLAALQANLPRKQQGGPVRRGGFDVGCVDASMPPPSIPPDTNVLPLRRRQIHHQRSNSEPVFSFPTYSGKGGQGGQGGGEVRSVPVLALLPDYSVLPADLINGQALSARAPIRNVLPVRSRDRTMSFDHAALLQGMGGVQDRSGPNRHGSRVDARGPARRKNKSRSMSEDLGRPQQQNKASFPQKPERKASTSKNTKSAPSKNEVKRLVNYQVLLARPIRTPWFRETPRNPNSGDEEEEHEASDEHEMAPEDVPEIATEIQTVSSPVSSPVLQAATVQFEEPAPEEAPSTPTPSTKKPNMGAKGTGFFCPSLH